MNKETLLERIGRAGAARRSSRASADIRDESDKSGMRVVIELKRGEVPEVVLNNLYKQTQLQDTFGMNMVALVDGQPRLLQPEAAARVLPAAPPRSGHAPHACSSCARRASAATCWKAWPSRWPTSTSSSRIIKAVADAAGREGRADGARLGFVAGARDADARRGRRRRRHEAFRPKACRSTTACRPTACTGCPTTQAQEILQMRLQRLTGLEQDKIVDEYREVMAQIADLLDILAKPARVTTIIGDELTAIKRRVRRQARARADRRAQRAATWRPRT